MKHFYASDGPTRRRPGPEQNPGDKPGEMPHGAFRPLTHPGAMVSGQSSTPEAARRRYDGGEWVSRFVADRPGGRHEAARLHRARSTASASDRSTPPRPRERREEPVNPNAVSWEEADGRALIAGCVTACVREVVGYARSSSELTAPGASMSLLEQLRAEPLMRPGSRRHLAG